MTLLSQPTSPLPLPTVWHCQLPTPLYSYLWAGGVAQIGLFIIRCYTLVELSIHWMESGTCAWMFLLLKYVTFFRIQQALLVLQAVNWHVCLVGTVNDPCLPSTFFSSRLCVIKDLIYSTCSKVFGVMETVLLHWRTKYLNCVNSSCRLCGKRVKRAKRDKEQGTDQETHVAACYIQVY